MLGRRKDSVLLSVHAVEEENWFYLLCVLYLSTCLANHFLNTCQPENSCVGSRVVDFFFARGEAAGSK